MKISPVGADLFHADGRTDRHDEANSRFSKFCKIANDELISLLFFTMTAHLRSLFWTQYEIRGQNAVYCVSIWYCSYQK